MRHLPSTLTLTLPLLLPGLCAFPTFANTEIIKFSAGGPISVEPFPENWTVLHAGANEIIVRDITPAPLREGPGDSLCDADNGKDVHPFMRRYCPHELWVVLDLDGGIVQNGDLDGKRENNKALKWKTHFYDRFTLRVSWPGSRPVQVELSLQRPHPVLSPTPSAPSVRTARLHFARIHLTQEGIRVPHKVEEQDTHGEKEEEDVPLVVLLEPLVLGVLPASVLPVAMVLLLLGVLGTLVATTAVGSGVRRACGEVIERARRELELAVVEERKGRKER